MANKARCTATTNAGKPCKASPIKGTQHCLAHNEKARETISFSGAQPGAGRPKLPRPSEIAQKLIEENVLALQRPYWRTLGFDVVIGENGPELVELDGGGAKLYGTQQKTGDIRVSTHDDLGAMMGAAEKLQDRVYGKPKQVSEISGPDGGPLTLEAPLDAAAKSVKAAELLKKHGHLDAGT